MQKTAFAALFALFALAAPEVRAFDWFGLAPDSPAETNKNVKLSVIMRPSNDLFEEAEELASARKTEEALAKYKETEKALEELRVKYPKQTDSAIFRNRLLLCKTRIDAFKLENSAVTSHPVNVTDTRELERRYEEKHGIKRPDSGAPAVPAAPAKTAAPAARAKPVASAAPAKPAAPAAPAAGKPRKPAKTAKTPPPGARPAAPSAASAKASMRGELDAARREMRSGSFGAARKRLVRALKGEPRNGEALYLLAHAAMMEGDTALADKILSHLLKEIFAKPAEKLSRGDAATLVLAAGVKSSQGDWRTAQRALDLAIRADPGSYMPYYNMALLMSDMGSRDLGPARRYYAIGREKGGPRDEALESRIGWKDGGR